MSPFSGPGVISGGGGGGGGNTNVNQLNGNTTSTNSGTKDAGTLRVVLATDQPALTNAQPVTPAATENHLGEVGNKQTVIQSIPTITSGSAYAAGNNIGGLITLANGARVAGGSGKITGVTIFDKAHQAASITALFFDANPSSSTFTDHAAAVFSSTDWAAYLGWARLTDYLTQTPSFGQAGALSIPFSLSGGATSLYMALISNGTPTYTSTTDLLIKIQIDQN